MKRAIIVRCKKCLHEWYVRENREKEFDKLITLSCPQCETLYKEIDFRELYVGKCSKFSLLPLMDRLPAERPRQSRKTSFIIVFVLLLILAVIGYILLHP